MDRIQIEFWNQWVTVSKVLAWVRLHIGHQVSCEDVVASVNALACGCEGGGPENTYHITADSVSLSGIADLLVRQFGGRHLSVDEIEVELSVKYGTGPSRYLLRQAFLSLDPLLARNFEFLTGDTMVPVPKSLAQVEQNEANIGSCFDSAAGREFEFGPIIRGVPRPWLNAHVIKWRDFPVTMLVTVANAPHEFDGGVFNAYIGNLDSTKICNYDRLNAERWIDLESGIPWQETLQSAPILFSQAASLLYDVPAKGKELRAHFIEKLRGQLLEIYRISPKPQSRTAPFDEVDIETPSDDEILLAIQNEFAGTWASAIQIVVFLRGQFPDWVELRLLPQSKWFETLLPKISIDFRDEKIDREFLISASSEGDGIGSIDTCSAIDFE
jgi:hypothetical protein